MRRVALILVFFATLTAPADAQTGHWRLRAAGGVFEQHWYTPTYRPSNYYPYLGYVLEGSVMRDLTATTSIDAGAQVIYSTGALVYDCATSSNACEDGLRSHIVSGLLTVRQGVPGVRFGRYISANLGGGYFRLMNAGYRAPGAFSTTSGPGIVYGLDVISPKFWDLSANLGARDYRIALPDRPLRISTLQLTLRVY